MHTWTVSPGEDYGSNEGQEALENADVYTIKFGGTRAAELRENADHVQELLSQGKKPILAISAMRSGNEEDDHLVHPEAIKTDNEGNRKHGFNTTDHLLLIANSIQEGNLEKAKDALDRIRTFTLQTITEQVHSDDAIENKEQALAGLYALSDAVTGEMFHRISQEHVGNVQTAGEDKLINVHGRQFSITGMGEELAKSIHSAYFNLRGVNNARLNGHQLDREVFGEESPDKALDTSIKRDEAFAKIVTQLRKEIEKLLDDNDVLISGGYYPGVGSERGYTEMTAALITVAVKEAAHKVACVIEGDYPLMSADPRKIPHAEFVQRATYALAFELFGNTGYGADGGAIHAPALEYLANNNIDTVMLNPNNPEQATLIQHFPDMEPNGVDVIASRKMPNPLLISTTKMRGPGFLEKIAPWFAERGVSIVHTPSSEVTFTITFNNGGITSEQVQEFREFMNENYGEEHVTVEEIKDQSLVYCLGNNMAGPGVLARASAALAREGIDIRIMTQGYTETVMVFGVDKDQAEAASKALHKACIEEKNPQWWQFGIRLKNWMAKNIPVNAGVGQAAA